MSKASRLRRKRAKARRLRSPVPRRGRGRRRAKILAAIKAVWYGVSTAWKVVLAILFVLAALSEIYFSTWRLSVTPGQTLKEINPMATMFILRNEGQFSIYDIEFSCWLNSVKWENDVSIEQGRGSTDAFNIRELEGNAETSSPCFISMYNPHRAVSVDVTLVVSYRPSFYPFHKERQFRFIAWPNEPGKGYSWTPMSK